MWQLSRQQISWQIIGRKFHLKQNSSRLKKKQVLIRIETKTFTVQGLFVTSRLSWPVTLRKLNTLWNKVQMSLIKSCDQICLRVRKSSTRFNTLAYRKGKNLGKRKQFWNGYPFWLRILSFRFSFFFNANSDIIGMGRAIYRKALSVMIRTLKIYKFFFILRKIDIKFSISVLN